jgi:hypothetical protein
MKIEITDKLYTDIVEYCKMNNIEDVDKFIKRILNQGFATEKWGTMSDTNTPKKEPITEPITEKKDNIDLYGERNVRKI